ncbi:hypothetical protein ACHAL6_00975 [Proteiniclasticum sp. C24MP]|uniref:hypothetical protein n=1 Tax=Proteiniclasticum sp. C24MP TaxID=3374101 RepID=UPI0037549D1D
MNYKTNIVLFSVIIILISFSGCSYGESSDKSPEEIRSLAYEHVRGNGDERILNEDTAQVVRVLIEEEHQIMGREGAMNIQGREVFKVTFTTSNDDLLGPIRVYLDVDTYDVIGVDYRF